MVHQHFMLIDSFTVLENVVLGAEGGALLAGASPRRAPSWRGWRANTGSAVDPDARSPTCRSASSSASRS